MIGIGPDLTERHREPEIMDDPTLDEVVHRQALRGLARVNAISRTAQVIGETVIRQLGADPGQHLRLLDVACGGGDVTIGIARWAKQHGLSMDVVGCDISPVAVKDATDNSVRRESDVTFMQWDVLQDGLPDGFDVIVCSLFLHHLSKDDAGALLRELREKAARLVVASDLIRSRWGYFLAWWGCRILTRSHVVHFDGPVSVRAALTIAELEQLASEAGMQSPQIVRSWPARMCLVWKRR
jgi:2-polyprenyl-3-methyl-5-hydroxy-6-metoxy-1,4-benzoquinol methylase